MSWFRFQTVGFFPEQKYGLTESHVLHAMLNMQTTDLCNRICNHTGVPGIAVHMRMDALYDDDVDGGDDGDDSDDDDDKYSDAADHWFRRQGSK